ncbi:TrmB family transcriptional regulator [Halapricum hydrolyticum]|uniref:TrmB family transcriptional regulator n=1 Tax=Halapricum hydrolyticum TaxID=2979991 RepID=A0AAE3IAW0_9EURY|nr:helix-turn-helix domain-containing protein [Halapricum hydrolyticum]MCU4717563.1 TrmB family transcriptional regulator [Halapricum hydrolyticum]MCU4726727.1 TrmB family transcriptional regulator [Halapricum hydrolyticum]
MDEETTVEALTRLGLTTYEARVFVALQRLGTGTASDVAEITAVPRSQVYGAAEDLQARGLLDVQQTRPTVYRPVSPEEAERRLLSQLESVGRDAFGYLADVRGSVENDEERSEAIWTIRGRANVRDRVIDLIDGADDRIVYGTPRPELLEDEVLAVLTEAADAGVDAAVVSDEPSVLESVPADGPVRVVPQPADRQPEVSTARVLLVDSDTLLMSVVSAAVGDDDQEVAFWSAGTAFATVLVTLSEELIELDR